MFYRRGILNTFIDKLLAAEENETEIMIDYHCDLVTFRLQFIPMDVTVGDSIIEIYDSERGEDVKIIIEINKGFKYDDELDEYYFEYNNGDLIVGFA